MKLIVTIPAYNEEKTMSSVIKSVPRKIKGVGSVEILVIDDGSTDKTVSIAKKAGADYVISNLRNMGLAKTFSRALSESVNLGADIIINTDADNQYDQKEISKLVTPIIENKADFVNGDRQVHTLPHMPTSKKYGNRIGSFVIRALTGVSLQDASSGFRAYSRECAKSFQLFSKHTYTHETIIQAAFNGMRIEEVPITFKKRSVGKSKLISGVIPHVLKSANTILRAILMYKAFRFFVTIGGIILLLGLIGCIRFLYFYFAGEGTGHVQSLIFSSILLSIGFNTIILGIIADLIAINRKLIIEK